MLYHIIVFFMLSNVTLFCIELYYFVLYSHHIIFILYNVVLHHIISYYIIIIYYYTILYYIVWNHITDIKYLICMFSYSIFFVNLFRFNSSKNRSDIWCRTDRIFMMKIFLEFSLFRFVACVRVFLNYFIVS